MFQIHFIVRSDYCDTSPLKPISEVRYFIFLLIGHIDSSYYAGKIVSHGLYLW